MTIELPWAGELGRQASAHWEKIREAANFAA